ncbi:SPOR domain-containing protein [Simplicispira psychrophila]|uniref:SPOR domain-containing protein n=1 Tax=Simplicispira psychrophila TaxID=80882 RepID=UPI0004869D06|nr:SPOR domain-containing protein [Simplicispira psychrophila]
MPPPRPLTPSSFADALGLPSSASNSAMIALYSAALGPVQLPRYLALFERFDRAGRAPLGWNLTASLVTLNWMALHAMWGVALVYLALIEGLGLVVFGVARPMLNMPPAIEYGLLAGLAIFAFALPGLFGDALLHTEIRKRIARAIATAPTLPEACALLERQASSRPRLLKIAAINVLLLTAVAAALILAPPSGWGQASPSADSAPTLSGKVKQVSADPGTPIIPATLPGLLSPAKPAAVLPASDAAQQSSALNAPVNAATPAPAYIPLPAQEPAAVPPAPLPPPLPAPLTTPALAPSPPPAPTAAPTKAEKKVRDKTPTATVPEKVAEKEPAKVPEKKPDTTPAKATKKIADRASAKLRKKSASPLPAPAEKAPVATASTPATSDSDSPLPTAGSAAGHYFNVGVFAEVGNARRAQAKLLNAGLPAFRQTVTSPKGELIRVRVGPFSSAAEAQKARQQIRRLGLEAVEFRQRAQ